MRQDQFSVSVSIDGRQLGVFDTKSGGQSEGEESKHRPGGMGREIHLGGFSSTENVTVSRLFKKGRDPGLIKWIRSRVGKGRMVVVVQTLDVDGNAYQAPETYIGVLQRFTPAEHDSNSSDAAMYELELGADEAVA